LRDVFSHKAVQARLIRYPARAEIKGRNNNQLAIGDFYNKKPRSLRERGLGG
jgi:hypothetical protein